MLWSLFKILLFVALVIALAFGVQAVLAVSGDVIVRLDGSEFVLTPLQLIIGALIAVVALYVAFKLAGLIVATLKFINGDDTAFSRYSDRIRERRGYDALSESLMALAAGEAREAATKAQKAEKYLNRPEVTTLLVAQAAEAVGDKARATEAWKSLVQHDRSRFVGVRGLMRQKLEEGDTDTAMKLAEKAFALKPKNIETQDTLLRLQARDANWDGARKVLSAKVKTGALPKDVYKRREAVLCLADARAQIAAGGSADKARAEALEANRLSPQLVPAAVLAARLLVEANEKRRAAKVIKAAWQTTQHPDLAAAFAAIEPDETPDARLRRFQALLKIVPNAPETKMLETELHLAAEDFPGARRALGTLAETHPVARSLTLMAAIERGEGAPEAVVRGWLAKALGASRGPQWVCENCGTVHEEWVPVCTSCEAFDSLKWTEASQATSPTSALPSAMLPLLIGGPVADEEEPEADTVEPVVEEVTVEATETIVDPDVVGTTRDVTEPVAVPVAEDTSEAAPREEASSAASRG
ncbi:heme biosynthesis protein HemY [Jannaschia pagri]|uniref:Heme biosynthesis protein HemY n=1 Tax=Jannaschia pagri TaxID=2829797 RepID=A0ABQ4NRB6_9RHOB|nr:MULTISPECIES: heme biosynthesis HemY N-terminal domain-containing protein [unclassified Jannaschia]GIT92959.1 heme biosynthesis protein HemY [Jannaschia sp. AI_61]GIT96794.1 heme biosynthesis protein HemY [Jannaschia sp. AI_62]